LKIRLLPLTFALVTLSLGQLRAEETAGTPSEASGSGMATNEQAPAATDDNAVQLHLDRELETTGNVSTANQQSTARGKAPELRMKLRMSTSIENLDVLSQETTSPGIDLSKPIDASNVQPGAVVIEGDRMQVYLDRKYKSIGNAALLKDKQNIFGDSLEYDVQNEELHVTGNTRIESGGVTITGPSMRMKLGESIGEMMDASFIMSNQIKQFPNLGMNRPADLQADGTADSSNTSISQQQSGGQDIEGASPEEPNLNKSSGMSRGDAKAVFFEGEDKKRLKGARYTTCEADSNDWYIKAGELELDDYSKNATAKNAYIEFKGVPILYTPWMSFSFVNQRQSGFLAPTWGTTSRSGFEVLTPYYWNIAPDMDATIATRVLTKRGLQLQGEFRYLGETYSGTNNIEYLPSDLNSNETRYYAKLSHTQNFGNGWSGAYNIEKVSDDKYFSEMTSRIVSTSRVNLPQQANIAYNNDVWSFNALVQKYQSLSTLSFPYSRLPQLTLNGNKDWAIQDSNITLNANIQNEWVSFDRKGINPILNNTSTTTTTVSSNVLTTGVTGNRFSTYPSISLPMAQPYGYVTPKLGIRHTSYSLNDPGFTLNGVNGEFESGSRTLPVFSVDSGLFFDRNVRVVKNNYTQTLEPRMYYVYIPYQDQSMLPVFDTAEADLNLGTLFLENQFTGNDRINNANQLSLAVTSRMIDAKTGQQRLAVTLGQRFYFADQKVGLPTSTLRTSDTSDIVAALTAKLMNNWNIDTAWQYNTDTSSTIKSNIGARYNPEPGKVLNLSYRYTRERLEQFNISGQWPLGKGYYGLGRWNYSISENQPIEGLAGIEYDAGCWQARAVLQRVATATANANYALFFQLELGGIASIGSDPMRLLNRTIPGYTNTNVLPESYRQQNYE